MFCSHIKGQALTAAAAAAAITVCSPYLSLAADIDMLVTY